MDRRAFVGAVLLGLAACGSDQVITSGSSSENTACISDQQMEVTVPSDGSVRFSVVPEGLPPGARIVSFSPCPNGGTVCRPGEKAKYFVPCEAAAPSLCPNGEKFVPVCSGTEVCPTEVDPNVFIGGETSCPLGPFTTYSLFTTVECPNGTQVTLTTIVRVTVPGDCDGDGRISDEEINLAIDAVFGGESCGVDVNLDGMVTADEVGRVIAFATRRAQTGFNCPIPEPTPTPLGL